MPIAPIRTYLAAGRPDRAAALEEVAFLAGNGRDPDPNAIRRNTRRGLVTLPSEGRKGAAPKWPLPDNPRLTARIDMLADAIDELEEKELAEGKLNRTDRTRLTRTKERLAIAEVERDEIRKVEKTLWSQAWHTPQAVEWKRLRWTHEVALYVRWMAAAQCGDLDAGKESRQYADRLGLTPRGMKSLMWVIAEDELAARRTQKQQAATGTDGARRHRPRAVDPPPS